MTSPINKREHKDMEKGHKNQVVAKLQAKIDRLGLSQNEAAKQMGVSGATVSNMLKGKWENITGAWQKVQVWLGSDLTNWSTATTENFKRIQQICATAQVMHTAKAISYRAGSGKTFAVKEYANTKPNTFYVCAFGDMSKRQLLKHLCKAMGLTQATTADMIEQIIEKINLLKNPLIIIDEYDELEDKALRIFKDLYNRCESVGFVLVGGLHLEKRITKGVRNSKQSMQEIYSRLGGEFHKLNENDKNTIRQICTSNGVLEEKQVSDIVAFSNGDLRRVKSRINDIKLNRIVKAKKQQQDAKA